MVTKERKNAYMYNSGGDFLVAFLIRKLSVCFYQ